MTAVTLGSPCNEKDRDSYGPECSLSGLLYKTVHSNLVLITGLWETSKEVFQSMEHVRAGELDDGGKGEERDASTAKVVQ